MAKIGDQKGSERHVMTKAETEDYPYKCPFCEKVTNWTAVGDSFAMCTTCKIKGSNLPQKCTGCPERDYIYVPDGEMVGSCAQCLSGFAV